MDFVCDSCGETEYHKNKRIAEAAGWKDLSSIRYSNHVNGVAQLAVSQGYCPNCLSVGGVERNPVARINHSIEVFLFFVVIVVFFVGMIFMAPREAWSGALLVIGIIVAIFIFLFLLVWIIKKREKYNSLKREEKLGTTSSQKNIKKDNILDVLGRVIGGLINAAMNSPK